MVGLEPDECYYIRNEPKVRRRNDIELRRDPPPDVAIEVDITHKPPGRQSIYSKLGVPEVWRYNGEKVDFLLLGKDGKYSIIRRSKQLPFLTSDDVTRFVKMNRTMDENSVIRAFIEWLRENVGT
jgi:Uma2 family endonuclease